MFDFRFLHPRAVLPNALALVLAASSPTAPVLAFTTWRSPATTSQRPSRSA